MNIYDVAKKAGVSPTTVSRVLNGSTKVSQHTQQRVKDAMEALDYSPNQLAIGLATNTTNTIGIMLPDVRDSFHAEVAYYIEKNMTAKGYTCILCNTSMENMKEASYLDVLYAKKVDGIILVGSSYHSRKTDETLRKWKNRMPVILVNAISERGTASVVCDERYGMTQALNHIKEKGRRHPIFVKDDSMYQRRASETKAQAFLEGYKAVFLDEQTPEILNCMPDEAEYIKILENIKDKQIDSIFFTSDLCCAIFLKAMQRCGLNAPGDYALIGFNNARITDLTSPTISTIDHLVKDHCEMAIDKLMKLMEGKEVEKVTYIQPEFVVKETT